MKLLQALLLTLIVTTGVAKAQNAPATTPPAAPPVATPVETVQPAIPAVPLPDKAPPSFSQDDIKKIETALKKQMMLVGMGSGVAGLLLGMMIGRKSAPRPTGRRY